MLYPCDGVFPLIDALGFVFWTRRLFLLQKLHSVPLVLQLCLIALPKLQEQRYYRQEMSRSRKINNIIYTVLSVSSSICTKVLLIMSKQYCLIIDEDKIKIISYTVNTAWV